MSKSINHTVFFPHAPEIVWEYLTQADLLSLWLMKNDIRPVVGHEFTFNINPIPQFDFDGIAHCKVLELVPMKKLVYSWKSGTGDGTINVDSVIEWTLVEKNNGTELHLQHSGFSEAGNILMYNAMDAGWLKNMQKLNEIIQKSQDGTTKN